MSSWMLIKPETISKVLSLVALHHHMKTFTKLHQFLHVLIRTHRVSARVLCHKEWISASNSDQITSIFLIHGLQTVPSTNSKDGQIHHNLRIIFGIFHRVLHEFFIHHAVLNHSFITLSWLLFKVFQLFIHHDLLIVFQVFTSKALTHVKFSTNSFNSLFS